MSTRTEYPNFVGNTGKFLKVNATETDVLWDTIDASDITGVLGIDHGGTGANNATDALNNLLPDQTSHAGEVLHTDGTDTYWAPNIAGGVQSVSGNGVNNTDPFNPVVRTANTTTEGTLTAADWNTFNNKQNAITTGDLSSPTSGVTVGTGTGRLVGGNSTISIATATGSQQGLLSSTDWNTFNNKQNALPTLCVVKAYKNLLGGAASPFIANTEVFDTTSSYDNATGIFTAPRTGYYLVTCSFAIESHSTDPSIASVQVIKNGSAGIDQDSIRFNGTEGASDYWKRRLKVSTTTNLTAGDTIKFNVSINTGTMSVTGGVEGNQITITELR